MNQRFFLLEENRQERILNAGYKEFAKNSYKKTSMSRIAEEGRISKSLLFHYFKNKQELYLHLYARAIEKIQETIPKPQEVSNKNIFEILVFYMECKWQVLKENPYLLEFINKVYYEEDEDLQQELKKLNDRQMITPLNQLLLKSSSFVEKKEHEQLKIIELLIYLAEGFAFVNRERIVTCPDEAMKEFKGLLLLVQNVL